MHVKTTTKSISFHGRLHGIDFWIKWKWLSNAFVYFRYCFSFDKNFHNRLDIIICWIDTNTIKIAKKHAILRMWVKLVYDSWFVFDSTVFSFSHTHAFAPKHAHFYIGVLEEFRLYYIESNGVNKVFFGRLWKN